SPSIKRLIGVNPSVGKVNYTCYRVFTQSGPEADILQAYSILLEIAMSGHSGINIEQQKLLKSGLKIIYKWLFSVLLS
ncbi:MAG: hypothetical protein ABW138_20435, partial [Candidatus Thiodiazotropha sp. 4PDIVS1]